MIDWSARRKLQFWKKAYTCPPSVGAGEQHFRETRERTPPARDIMFRPRRYTGLVLSAGIVYNPAFGIFDAQGTQRAPTGIILSILAIYTIFSA